MGAIGKLIYSLVPSAIGSAIALKLNTTELSTIGRLFSFLCGVGISHYFGGAGVEHFELEGFQADAVRVMAGMFGLSLAATLNTQIPSLVSSARTKYVGGDK